MARPSHVFYTMYLNRHSFQLVHSCKRHYKQDWHAFVQAFKKQFSSQKNAYYAQVEALTLSKKYNETVRHLALDVQQLVEKGWCNENASTINLKCNEIFTEGLPKNLKDFANKRQVKHTSTVLEPSISRTFSYISKSC